MDCCRLPRGSPTLGILLGVLCACTSAPHQNITHPSYGDTEYKSDLAQCRRENSTVVTTEGYDFQTKVQVDETKADACMTVRGWQKAGG